MYQYNFSNVQMNPVIPNPTFIFHNKLPKSGSTTMNDIMKLLSTRNHFYYKKMEAIQLKYDDEAGLTNFLKQNLEEPFFLTKGESYTAFRSLFRALWSLANKVRFLT